MSSILNNDELLRDEDFVKQGELNLISSGWAELKNGNLDACRNFILEVLRDGYSDKTVDMWSVKWYCSLGDDGFDTELERLAKTYLSAIKEKYHIPSDDEKVSHFSKYELGVIDQVFEDWKENTSHKGESSKKLFLGWLKSECNRLGGLDE